MITFQQFCCCCNFHKWCYYSFWELQLSKKSKDLIFKGLFPLVFFKAMVQSKDLPKKIQELCKRMNKLDRTGLAACIPNLQFCNTLQIGLQRYTVIPVHRNIFGHDTNIVRWTSYSYINDTFTYASTNMGKHYLQLVLTLLPLFSLYAQRFSEQTDEKKPCRAVFSVIFKMADKTNACMLPTRLVSCTDFWAHEQDKRRFVVM